MAESLANMEASTSPHFTCPLCGLATSPTKQKVIKKNGFWYKLLCFCICNSPHGRNKARPVNNHFEGFEVYILLFNLCFKLGFILLVSSKCFSSCSRHNRMRNELLLAAVS
jgi:hypothetical protein